MTTDGFPGAIWIPAHTDRYARRESRVIEELVLHITEGGTDKAEITAHNAFGGPKFGVSPVAYVVRSDRTGTASLVNEIRQAVWSVNADVPVALQITVSGRVASGRIIARPPRRSLWEWLLRRPRRYAISS